MARRILNRKDLRNDYDAAERRKDEEEEVEGAAEETDEDEEEEEAANDEDEGDEEGEEAEAEEKPKKKKPAPKAKPKAKPRSRAVKITRMRVVWGVFNNSNQCVSTFEYPRRKEADALAAKLTVDKKNTHFVQPVKEPIEQKKEE